MNEEAEEDWRYWKAAISRLPTQEMRDAAWEFFVRHFSQNPKMADTLSGLILVMQANGLYMLEAPKMIQEQVVDPLNEALTRFRTELDRAIDRHKTSQPRLAQTAEIAVTAIKGLGRRNPQRLAGSQCSKVGRASSCRTGRNPSSTARNSMPAIGTGGARRERSGRTHGGFRPGQLRGFHFKEHSSPRCSLAAWLSREVASLSVGRSFPVTTSSR